MWVAFLANTLIVTAPLLLAQNPVSVITETVNDAKRVRTGRGKLFLVLSAFFFVEGLGVLAQPNLAQRVASFIANCLTAWKFLFVHWPYIEHQNAAS